MPAARCPERRACRLWPARCQQGSRQPRSGRTGSQRSSVMRTPLGLRTRDYGPRRPYRASTREAATTPAVDVRSTVGPSRPLRHPQPRALQLGVADSALRADDQTPPDLRWAAYLRRARRPTARRCLVQHPCDVRARRSALRRRRCPPDGATTSATRSAGTAWPPRARRRATWPALRRPARPSSG